MPKRGRNRPKNRRKRARKPSQDSNKNDEAQKARPAERSLGWLAVKFLEIASQSESKSVELHQAAESIGVRKRRIYDVTNVLEGLGLFGKASKNRVGWRPQGNIGDLRTFHDEDSYRLFGH